MQCRMPTAATILFQYGTRPLLDSGSRRKTKAMKRSFVLILAVLAAAALFAGLVHAVLVTAQVSEPAATTVYGLTPRRLWATTVALLALIGVIIGWASSAPVCRSYRHREREMEGHRGPGGGA